MNHRNVIRNQITRNFRPNAQRMCLEWSKYILLKPNLKELGTVFRFSQRKFPTFYGTRRFITVFARARYRSLTWHRWIQSTHFHPISLRSILILSSHLLPRSSKWSLPFRFSDQNFIRSGHYVQLFTRSYSYLFTTLPVFRVKWVSHVALYTVHVRISPLDWSTSHSCSARDIFIHSIYKTSP